MKTLKTTIFALITIIFLSSCSTDDDSTTEDPISLEANQILSLTSGSVLSWESSIITFDDDGEVLTDNVTCSDFFGLEKYDFNADGTYVNELLFVNDTGDCEVISTETGNYEIIGDDTSSLEIRFEDDEEGFAPVSLDYNFDEVSVTQATFIEGREATITFIAQ